MARGQDPGRGDRRGEGGGSLRFAVLFVGFCLAAGATAAVLVTRDPKVLRLAVLGALWAFLLAALAVPRRRSRSESESDIAPGREIELRRTYETELEREVAARREYELQLEVYLRRELEQGMRKDVEALREEVDRLRSEVLDRLDGELRMERIETTRLIGGSLRALQDEARRLGISRSLLDDSVFTAGELPAAPEPEPVRGSSLYESLQGVHDATPYVGHDGRHGPPGYPSSTYGSSDAVRPPVEHPSTHGSSSYGSSGHGFSAYGASAYGASAYGASGYGSSGHVDPGRLSGSGAAGYVASDYPGHSEADPYTRSTPDPSQYSFTEAPEHSSPAQRAGAFRYEPTGYEGYDPELPPPGSAGGYGSVPAPREPEGPDRGRSHRAAESSPRVSPPDSAPRSRGRGREASAYSADDELSRIFASTMGSPAPAVPPEGTTGQRRRRYRDDGDEDDVLSRLLGRN